MPLGTIQKGTYEYKTKKQTIVRPIERNETQRRLEMSRWIDWLDYSVRDSDYTNMNELSNRANIQTFEQRTAQ